jgi:predicted acylesterase/phospholipase RssA
VIPLLPDEALDAARARVAPLEEAELALVRSVVSRPAWLAEPLEHGLRYALNLARLGLVRAPDGADVDLSGFLAPYREELAPLAQAILGREGGPDTSAVGRLAAPLAAQARAWRTRLLDRFGDRLPAAALDRECCEKALALVCGGGGGVAWTYLGAFDVLEQFGLTPRLIGGTSMGSALALLRARSLRWDGAEVRSLVQGLSFRQVFRFLHSGSRYGLPAAMQLHLRAAVGTHLLDARGQSPTLAELPIPLVVACTGVRTGALPHEPEYYEHLLDVDEAEPRPHLLARLAGEVFEAIGEFMVLRDRFARVYLGIDEGTSAFDAVDAVGFSSSLPGVIHYDVLRDDQRMRALLDALFERRDLLRLVDGGLVDNLPARPVWAMGHGGLAGTRNVFVLGLEGFAPKLTQPLWYGLEQLAAQNVGRSRPFVHHLRSFQRVLSPSDVIPDERALERAVQGGRTELLPDLPFVARMVRPFPALA